MNPEYKKIGEVEMVIGLVFLSGLYLMNDVVDGLVVGVFVVPLINWFCTGINWWFFKNKGDLKAGSLMPLIAQCVGGAIPFVPAPLITFGVKVYFHNHPKIVAATGAPAQH